MRLLTFLLPLALLISVGAAPFIAEAKSAPKSKTNERPTQVRDGLAEARLIDIYRLIGDGRTRDALKRAEQLVADYPHFQLAQLVLGDLLSTRSRPIQNMGDVPAGLAQAGSQNLQALRAEAQLRIAAIKERPPIDSIPSQFVALSRRNKHAIAVDTAKARLYLFKNTATGTRLLADYYISVGKAGVSKDVEGDQRTPLGVYFITSKLDPKNLKDLYGSGALPVNYPNVLDLRRGKTGGGIWLHGTPSTQFTRAPQATDGCVAVANPDLTRIIETVEIRTTPVLIGKNFKWVRSTGASSERQAFSDILQTWARAKKRGQESALMEFYASDFSAEGRDLNQFSSDLRAEVAKLGKRAVRINDVSLIRWTDEADIMVATFGEVLAGNKSGRTVRQYWQQRNNVWKIIYEGAIG
jgi:murein L,D-transpeptidase YafK